MLIARFASRLLLLKLTPWLAAFIGCDAIVQAAMIDICNGLLPETLEGAVWSTEDCRIVLEAIAKSPHAAVRVMELVVKLGAGGALKLKSMNKMNLLLRRMYDPRARDIDSEAFGPLKEVVYTLPSAAHLVAARSKLASFASHDST